MAYYLGRDVKVFLTTESPESQVSVVSNAVSALGGGASSVAVDATATITITDLTELNNGDKVNLIATDATSHDFTVGEVAGGGTWIAETTNTISATNLSAAINANAKFSTTRSGAVITVTQAKSGTDGNTTVTLTDTFAAGMTASAAFTGGTDGVVYSAAIFAENLDEVLGTVDGLTRLADLTGVDLSIGVTDEDVTFMGSKTVLKAEIKKETTVSLTRKKSNNVWDVVYNGPTASGEGWTGSATETGEYGARWGVIEGSADNWYIMNGSAAPKDITDFGGTDISFGYRVFIQLGPSEIISIPGCQLTGHSITLNADGTTEETCELISHVTPKIGSTIDYTRLTAGDM
jgi:hypothetical protein